jgi:hypothetical protein
MKRLAIVLTGLLAWCGVSAGKVHAEAAEPAGFEYNFLFGMATGPFDTDSDLYIGANIDLPIFKKDPILGQQLSGDLMVGWTQTSDSGTFNSPNVTVLNVAAVPTAASEFDLTTVQVIPGLKYKLNMLGPMIQPYVVLGVAFNVVLSKTEGPEGERAGGIAPISPELQSRNVPVGQGDVIIGGNFGGGVDIFLFQNLLLGADFRYNMMDRSNASFQTILGKFGFRF